MREIIFKAKRVDNGEWVKGDLIHEPFGMYIQSMIDGKRIKYKVIECTISQYTGLTDKNGNKIWENDIISYPKIYAKGKVIFMEDTFVLFDEYDGKQYINGMWNKFEVIGNAFDNADLLKGE